MTLNDVKARCDEVGDCWIWRGSVQAGDVPAMRLPVAVDPQKRLVAVRRWVAENQGRVTQGLFATNSCQDKKCVCPDHIQLLSRKQLQKRAGKTMTKNQNPASKMARVRARIRAGNIKIGPENAIAIRESDKPAEQWAQELGCSVSAIFRAKRGEVWKEYGNPFQGLMT